MSLGMKQESQPRETTGFETDLNQVCQVMNVGPETGYCGSKYRGFLFIYLFMYLFLLLYRAF